MSSNKAEPIEEEAKVIFGPRSQHSTERLDDVRKSWYFSSKFPLSTSAYAGVADLAIK